jgi:AraC family transcriptional regulator
MQDLRLRTYAAGETMAPHVHEQSSFTVVLDGSYHELILGRSVEHRPGSMLFYPAGEMHSQQFGRCGSHKLIFRPDDFCLQLLADEGVSLSQAPHIATTLIRGVAARIANEMRQADPFSSMVMEGSMLELIATFGRMKYTDNRQPSIPSWVKQCYEMLESQPGVGVTHEVLARQVKKHPVHLAKAFRKAYGETIGECQRRFRLSKAQSLLRTRRLSLADVALECGYSSQSHFSRSFRCAFGTTPARYRQVV